MLLLICKRSIACCVFGILCTGSLYAYSEDVKLARRVHSHITIHDLQAAHAEAVGALAVYPRSQPLHEIYIRTLAEIGDEQAMLQARHVYVGLFP